jgi:two-component system cell cycle response regulator
VGRRLLLIDPVASTREALASRLRRQGFEVTIACDGAEGARLALTDPPSAVVADLWMPSISGVQLCRLLSAEPATSEVPVVLRGEEGRRPRFWAERAGALAYVVKGRMGELVRALARAMARNSEGEFFTVLPDDGSDVRDRIAAHLDAALFDSVIAAEVRNLAVCESFDRLFDRFAQFASEVVTYRWLAVHTVAPARLGLHASPGGREAAEREARAVLELGPEATTVSIEDEDAIGELDGPEALVSAISFGDACVGSIAIAPERGSEREIASLLRVFARELGGAVRMSTLVEETRRLATIDALTGLNNRRAFIEATSREVARADRYVEPLSLVLFDLDHFKLVNDVRGHAAGDCVLRAIGRVLRETMRAADFCARWGGEEFVVSMPQTSASQAKLVAERLRAAIASATIADEVGAPIPVTASLGIATLRAGETLDAFVDRADRAMYVAKSSGRNRVCASESETPSIPTSAGGDAAEARHLA